jgi:two-component system, chemotaxis family, chemotaxis protein CheY
MLPTILIIDDDEAILVMLEDLLEDSGKIIAHQNPLTALEWTRHNPPPSVALVDMMMPHLNGKELIERLRADERYRNIPILVVTASAENREAVERLGVQGYIRKPFDFKGLRTEVERWL